jgi:hypothetical protein
MPRPQSLATTFILLDCLHAIPAWYAKHKPALLLELDDDDASDLAAQTLAQDLLDQEEATRRERKEDKAVITERDALLVQARTLATEVRSAVTRRVSDKVEGARLLEDFRFKRVSHVRSNHGALNLLQEIKTALDTHKALLGSKRIQAWYDQIADLQARLEANKRLHAQETSETQIAQAQRDNLKRKAARLLWDLELAAQSVFGQAPEALTELEMIFDAHNPLGRVAPQPDEGDAEDTDLPTPS